MLLLKTHCMNLCNSFALFNLFAEQFVCLYHILVVIANVCILEVLLLYTLLILHKVVRVRAESTLVPERQYCKSRYGSPFCMVS